MESGKRTKVAREGGEVANEPWHTYNIVFSFTGSDRLTKHAFCTIRQDVAIQYASDLNAIRELLSPQFRDVVVLSWHEMQGVDRPGGAVPSIELTAPTPHHLQGR